MSESNLDNLQRVRVVTGLRRSDHITPALQELHWLPIRATITFKIATVVYHLRERRQPPYLADLISNYVPTRTLRSSTKTLLAEPSFRTNITRRSFGYVAAKTWNNLPGDINTVDSSSFCRKCLKTFVFRQSYCCSLCSSSRSRITLLHMARNKYNLLTCLSEFLPNSYLPRFNVGPESQTAVKYL